MIGVEFREVRGSNPNADVCILRAMFPVVPLPGEVVGINGNPYVVHDRSWAVEYEQEGPMKFEPTLGTGSMHCYVRVVRHHKFWTEEDDGKVG